MDEMEIDSAPGGTKRKADDDIWVPRPRQRIRALDPDVVNKIAAGEIIVAPVHALKELIENAVDAGSTSLEILVKDGGLKLLQITDNGGGIEKEDLEILCVRHTTSKISTFEDLSSIATYGFRGEALASISHIAHLTVTTKTKEAALAWRAHYLDGKLAPAKPGQSAEPKAVAGRQGTQITVEDLFFNVPTRRRAFRSYADEFNKIIDMTGRYAVHCKGVGFTCKKAGEASNSLSVQAQATVIDRIRNIYGGMVANELIELTVSDDRWGFSANGYVTNANYGIKKSNFLLFINHRCVESSTMKKAIEQTYTGFLPKGGHPFIYLSLEIDPARVDVNVHPTKREVHFLNEEEVIQAICKKIESELAAVDESRTFLTQSLLPGAKPVEPLDEDDSDVAPKFTTPALRKVRRNSNDLVRTDKSQGKITSMFSPAGPADKADSPARAMEDEPFAVPEPIEYTTIDRDQVNCRLRSIKELRQEARDEINEELTEMIASHTFVGVVDEKRRLAAIQAGVKLYLIDYGHMCFEYFYQLGLTDFGNFGVINFSPPLDLRELLQLAVEKEHESVGITPEDGFNYKFVVKTVANALIERREMLQEYFSLEITPTGEVVSIPLLVKGYTPSIAKLPRFLLRLGPYVNWNDEKQCFKTFLTELATFYVPEALPTTPTGEIEEEDLEESYLDDEQVRELNSDEILEEVRKRRQHVRWAVEHVFFPAFRSRLIGTTKLMQNAVLEVASLKGLYKVFERC
ncbi:DNA mismatch repair protein MLH1 [Trichoderma lentiforme]|uniref:DNA mismatch repair protein MLH1 n=1 Tax=Trichoderma lentiforme TaxID=1567552 RepID=A0A9P4XGE1_9HYPO|nr:DNA mismatch repair protein MLH1 [Trichoderma lentiforme]